MRVFLSSLLTLAVTSCTTTGNDPSVGGVGGKADDGGPAVARCNMQVFGVDDPGPLEPLWAQNYVGSGMLRDTLLTEAERAVPVTIANTSEDVPSPAFRALYPDADWGPVRSDDEGNSHSHNTFALVLGPFASSILPLGDGRIDQRRDQVVDISTNQGGGCSEPESPRELAFGAAGNSATAVGTESFARCLFVGAADPLGYASDYSSGRPVANLVATYSDLSILAQDHELFGGTSAAAPVAAGVGAHVRKVAPDLSPDEVMQILRLTAEPPRADDPRAERNGAGRLDLPRAIALARKVRDGAVTLADVDDAVIASLAVAGPAYADVRALAGDDCGAYADGVRDLYTAALLEPPSRHDAKRELAAFYRAHGVILSALYFERAAHDDAGLIAASRAIFANRALPVDRRGVALVALARAGVLDQAQLLAIGDDPDEDKFVALRALRIVGMQGGTTEAVCRRVVDLAVGVDRYDDAHVMVPALLWSEGGEPLVSECEALGITWE
jgi:hypothetical protein